MICFPSNYRQADCRGPTRIPQPRAGFSIHAFTRCWLVGLALIPLVSFAASTDSTAVPKLFEKYCYECHGDGAKKGGIELDTLVGTPPAKNHREWEKEELCFGDTRFHWFSKRCRRQKHSGQKDEILMFLSKIFLSPIVRPNLRCQFAIGP